jgi:hypothetical protein
MGHNRRCYTIHYISPEVKAFRTSGGQRTHKGRHGVYLGGAGVASKQLVHSSTGMHCT